MVKTTKAQRVALHRKYIQDNLRHSHWIKDTDGGPKLEDIRYSSYKDMRRNIQPTIGCDDAITVQWCGMWLCIETDGYTHS